MCAPAAQHASSKPRSELPTRPTAAGIVRRIPAVDLWTTRQSMQPSAKKCYPCCRIKVLPMLPVAQGGAQRSRAKESATCAAARSAANRVRAQAVETDFQQPASERASDCENSELTLHV